MDKHIETIASVLAGCSVAAILAKMMIAKALTDLDKLSDKVSDISKELSAVTVRLERVADHDEILQEHTMKLAYYEGINGLANRPVRQ